METANCKTGPAANEEMLSFASFLRAAPQAKVSRGFSGRVMSAVRMESAGQPRHFAICGVFTARKIFAAAASIAVLLGICSLSLKQDEAAAIENLVAHQRADGSFSSSSAAPYVQAFAVRVLAKNPSANTTALKAAVRALVASQNADGSWMNAQVTARNVAALGDVVTLDVEGVRRAYKRGVRYLRTHSISMPSSNEMTAQAQKALAGLATQRDAGLVFPASLCAQNSHTL